MPFFYFKKIFLINDCFLFFLITHTVVFQETTLLGQSTQRLNYHGHTLGVLTVHHL